MHPYVPDAQNEVRSKLPLGFEAPVLNHAWASIAGRQVSWPAKPGAEASVVLSRVQVGRRWKARNAGIKRNDGSEGCTLAWRGCKPVREGLSKIPVVKWPVVDGVSAPEDSFPEVAE